MSLPGVESARRRRASHGRFHSTSNTHNNCTTRSNLSTKRIVFGTTLYPTDHNEDDEINNNFRSEQRQERALEARNRLHEKLRSLWPASSTCRPHRTQQPPRSNVDFCKKGEGRFTRSPPGQGKVSGVANDLDGQQHVLGGQAECPVCLDAFLGGQRVTSLPCRHSFHSDCLLPWLLNHRHCPLCRSNILLQPQCRVDSSLL